MNYPVSVSVIMPMYNAARTIEDSIYSVLGQTYQDLELIVVDDASNDDGGNHVRRISLTDSRVQYLRLDVNSGAATARNVALKMAKGKYIAFLDADDVWLPEKLNLQISFMEQNNYWFTCTQYYVREYNTKSPTNLRKPPPRIEYNTLLAENVIGCLTVMYDRSALGIVCMPNIRKRQDFGTWLKILKTTPCFCLEKPLSIYNVLPNSISSNKLDAMIYNYKLFHSVEKLSWYRSLFWVIVNVVRKIRRSIISKN